MIQPWVINRQRLSKDWMVHTFRIEYRYQTPNTKNTFLKHAKFAPLQNVNVIAVKICQSLNNFAKNLALNVQLAGFHLCFDPCFEIYDTQKNYIQYYIDKYLKWFFKLYIWNIFDCLGIIRVKTTSTRENCYSSKVGKFSAQSLLMPQGFIVLRLKIKKIKMS